MRAHLPATIGLMVIALLGSPLIIALAGAGLPLIEPLARLLDAVDFHSTLLRGMLGALLFAGALRVNVNDLASQKWVIGLLATTGVSVAAWQVFGLIGLQVELIYCLLFGALISPTDPTRSLLENRFTEWTLPDPEAQVEVPMRCLTPDQLLRKMR